MSSSFTGTSLTLQQVFFRLYDDWEKLKMEWSKLQSDKKAELAQKTEQAVQRTMLRSRTNILLGIRTLPGVILRA